MSERKPKAALEGWCQVRISAKLAAAVAQLPPGRKSEVVRAALVDACRDARIPISPRKDPRQLALPVVTSSRKRAEPRPGNASPSHGAHPPTFKAPMSLEEAKARASDVVDRPKRTTPKLTLAAAKADDARRARAPKGAA